MLRIVSGESSQKHMLDAKVHSFVLNRKVSKVIFEICKLAYESEIV